MSPRTIFGDTYINDRDEETLKTLVIFLFEILFDKHFPWVCFLRCSLYSERQHQPRALRWRNLGRATIACFLHPLFSFKSLFLTVSRTTVIFSHSPSVWAIFDSLLHCVLVCFLSSQHKLQSSREREPHLRKMSPSDCCVGVEGSS